MADLIDREQLEQTIINRESKTSAVVFDYNSYLTGKAKMQMEILDIIKKQPTVDTENALEKQIPKKIKISEYESFGLFFFCPNCGVNIGNRLYKQKYCHNCGQNLDWEDVK